MSFNVYRLSFTSLIEYIALKNQEETERIELLTDGHILVYRKKTEFLTCGQVYIGNREG